MPPPLRIARNIIRRVLSRARRPPARGVLEQVHAERRHGDLPVVPGRTLPEQQLEGVPALEADDTARAGLVDGVVHGVLHGSRVQCPSTLEEAARAPPDTYRHHRGPTASVASNRGPLLPDRPVDHARAAPRLRARPAVGELPADPGLGRGEGGVAQRVDRLVRAATASWSAPGWCSTASCPRSSATSPTSPRARSSTGRPTTSAAWLTPMVAHLKGQGAFGVRMGPPVVTRRWTAAQVKEGIADDDVRRLGEVAPDRAQRRRRPGRRRSCTSSAGGRRRSRAASPPASRSTTSQIPLRDADGNARTEEDVLKGMNQQWRRNIKKADKAGRRGRRVGSGDRPQGLPRPLRPHRRARPLHPAAAGLLPDHVRGARRRGARPDPALPRPPRGRPGRGHDLDPGRRATRGTPTAPPPPRSATSAAPTPCSGR